MNCEEIALLTYNSNGNSFTCNFRNNDYTIKDSEGLFHILSSIQKVKLKNNASISDNLAKEMTSVLSYKINNYIITTIKNAERKVEGLIFYMNKADKFHNLFSKIDKLLAYISGYLLILCDKINNANNILSFEKTMKANAFFWTEELLSTISQNIFMTKMEEHVKEMLAVERVTVYFFDSKRNELFQRNIKDQAEFINSMIIKLCHVIEELHLSHY